MIIKESDGIKYVSFSEEDISLRAKAFEKVIREFTDQHLIGPAIKRGSIRRRLKEPPWVPPKDIEYKYIQGKKFRMEMIMPADIGQDFKLCVLQLHGGGYIGAMRNIYRDFAVKYAEMRGGMPVFTPDYRVAPADPFPAALEDVIDSYRYIVNKFPGIKVIAAGDSAGGGLALALTAHVRDTGGPLPAALVLMSPWADLTASGPSYTDNYESDIMFGKTHDSMIYNGEYPGDHDPHDPMISPIYGSFKRMPETFIQSGSDEMLLSDSESVWKGINSEGGHALLHVYKGMFHVFQMGLDRMPESAYAWNEVKEFIEGIDL
ncbi:MAG: alpha/beta hydrolase [Lachnospiraceae bacterium]|jgi:monoterpene epsilon-lactone hydrolase|nr:alpha/beta hydrolase [Lachnospiraceae bacterium]MEE3460964.1 alpha/beta hydrolase [Lachnospiraceae bacterium]